MYSTRREALRSVGIFSGALFFSRVLAACAVDAEPGLPAPEGKEPVGETNDALTGCKPPVISMNHGHRMVVSAADVAAGSTKTYSIKGTSKHDHTVIITSADFATLAMGNSVTFTSSNDDDHTHTVTVTCAAAAPAACGNGAKSSVISDNHGHSLVIAKEDVAAGVPATYSIQGTAPHDHQVSINAAQFKLLRSGKSITVTSSSAMSHVHTVKVVCA